LELKRPGGAAGCAASSSPPTARPPGSPRRWPAVALAVAVWAGTWQVIARFATETPSIWSEALVRTALIWMAYLGLAVALRTGALVSIDVAHRLSSGSLRRGIEAAALACNLSLMGILLWFGWIMAERVQFQEWRAGGVDELGLRRPADRRRLRRDRGAGAVPRPTDGRAGERGMSGAMLSVMLVLFAAAVPVAVAIGLASVWGIAGFTNFPLIVAAQQLFVSLDRFPLAAIPFFILAGNLMDVGGISRRLVDFAKSIVGGVQGGLPATCIVTCMIFAAISGSSVATTFAIGSVMIPALIKHGYPVAFAAALQATAAELGVIIPPSIPMILYGVSTQTSIPELFLAGVVPGLLIGGR
jgi:TRAP-type C4-dicarboxylate transport system permease small subunit